MIRKLRAAWRVAGVIAGFGFCVPFHYLWKLTGARSPWPRIFLGWTARRSGLRVTVVGRPLPANALYVANHLSWLDIFAIGGASPAIFVAKSDVKDQRVFGWASSLNDCIYINRDVRSTVLGQADDLREGLVAGRAVCLFPEGTTGAGDGVLPFRPSLFASLYPPIPGLMVQPVAVDFGPRTDDAAWIGDEDYGVNLARMLGRPGHLPVTLRFLDPIDPAEAGDRKRTAFLAREAIVAALEASGTLAPKQTLEAAQ
jgi:lyso-ornithine lipid O-acyltransferase